MKKYLTLKNILIATLLVVVLLLWFIRPKPEPVVIDRLVEVQADLTQEIKDSLAKVPRYAFMLDSIENVLDRTNIRLGQVGERLNELLSDIEDNTVDEDIELFAINIQADTMPVLTRIDNSIWVAILPDHLKRVNNVFAQYNSYKDEERPILLGKIGTLEKAKGTLEQEVGTLLGVIDLHDERFEVSTEINDQLKSEVKRLTRVTRWQKVGIAGGVLVGALVGAAIF